ncbi:unnamed protein product [Arabis nemorensis]|uniref:Auxin response factor domain-containing protein n=1 Tax=Arabis nemorensis TaxID=586526 RepID=A0A565BEH3_9BRAS|nr:unnamed protein product [Arabis nemorensis]
MSEAVIAKGFRVGHFQMALATNVQSTSEAMSEALYTELWNACAGPLVTLPRKGERVYYFPEGHMEQLEASMNQPLEQQMPSFDLSSKILCQVPLESIHLVKPRLKVGDLLVNGGREWNQALLEVLFPDSERRLITENIPRGRDSRDEFVW